MADTPILELHSITKRFGGLTALNELSFHIGEGEVVGLLGDNGAGKSTTVNLISGIHRPSSGHLSVDGKQTLFTCRTDSAEAGIETIYQNTALVDDLSITRNIFMGRERTNALGFLKEGEMREIAMEVLKSAVHISGIDSPDKLVGDLSGGQKQAVAIARAVFFKRRVLLLDEPFSALDRNLRSAMQVELREIQSRLGLTTVFVTHDQSEALSMSDRIAVMSRGRIRQIGTPSQIYDRPENHFVSTFVGDANLFAATLLEKTDATASLDIGTTRLSLTTFQEKLPEPGPVTLFVRPEQCSLTDPDQPGAIAATVALSVYQGSYAELHLDCSVAENGRVMLRVPASEAMEPGTDVGIALPERGPAIYTTTERET